MAYEMPTAADLIARYPAFANVAPATIDIHLGDAAKSGVDTSWRADDYAPAIVHLAAHNMALLDIGEHGEAAGFARAGVTRIRSGNFDAAFSEQRVNAASGGGFDATPYGRQYKTLLRKNKAGPRVVGPRPGAGDWGHIGQLNDGGYTPWDG